MTFDVTIPDQPGALRRLRDDLRCRLREVVTAPTLESALVVASELVTNANLHGGDGACRLRVTVRYGGVRVEAIDSCPRRPHPGRAAADDESGRGLVLVSALARRWGSAPHRLGKSVWAEIPAAGTDG